MSEAAVGGAHDLLAIYDHALEEVYGYLLHRCGHVQVAEDLTSETFPVREVASLLGRTEHATEALLVRAREAFRRAYERGVTMPSDPFEVLRRPSSPARPDQGSPLNYGDASRRNCE